MFRVKTLLSMGSFLMERIFRSTPNSDGTYWVAAICAVHIDDWEGWWLSG